MSANRRVHRAAAEPTARPPRPDPAYVIGSAVAGARVLCESAERTGWRGPDPYDGLWWRWPEVLTRGRRRRQAIAQIHARSPFDVRRLYRSGHPLNPKALGVYGSARLRLHRLTGVETERQAAERPLHILLEDETSGSAAWGYPWDVQTRWSFYPAGTPNVVVTSYAASALAEAADTFDLMPFAKRAARAATWVQEELFDPDLGVYCYHPESRRVIHNANLLGARLTHRLLSGDTGGEDSVRRAVERTLAAQRRDGSWPYGEGERLGFVDSFHTGYVLNCLTELESLDPRVPEALERGARYYVDRFFGGAGQAHLWPDRPFPEDAHSAGTGLTSLAALVRRGLADRELLTRVAARASAHMLTSGHAIHRRYRWGTSRVHYIRWADAHLALGFADAASVLSAQESPAPRTANRIDGARSPATRPAGSQA
jgi:hypothetical protein